MVYRDGKVNSELIRELTEEILANVEKKMDRTWDQRRYPRRHMAALRREFHNELRAMQGIQRRLARTRNPEVRAALSKILNDSLDMGIDLDELLGALPGSYNTDIKDRMNSLLSRNGLLLLLLALLTLLAVPPVREKIRPGISKIIEQAMTLGESARTLAAQLRESFEDIIAEAQFDRLKKNIEDTGPPEPQTSES